MVKLFRSFRAFHKADVRKSICYETNQTMVNIRMMSSMRLTPLSLN